MSDMNSSSTAAIVTLSELNHERNVSLGRQETLLQDPLFYVTLGVLAVTVYFVIVLSLYERKIRKKSRNFRVFSHGKLAKDGFDNIPRVLGLVSSVLLFATVFLYEFFRIFFEKHSGEDLCDASRKILNVIYLISISSFELVYWFRQRNFYTKAFMKIYTSRMTRFLSLWSILLVFLVKAVFVVLLLTRTRFSNIDGICLVVEGMSDRVIFSIVTYARVVLFHGLMAYLFAYPLLKRRALAPLKDTGRRYSKTGQDLLQIVYRSFVASVLNMAVDIFAVVVTFVLKIGEWKNISLLLVEIANLLLTQIPNLNWKERLLPCFSVDEPQPQVKINPYLNGNNGLTVVKNVEISPKDTKK